MAEQNEQYDTFRRWDVVALKTYLSKRGLSTIGRKDLLVSRAFAAFEMDVPEKPSQTAKEAELEKEYKSLLTTGECGILPDPFYELEVGWHNEKTGMALWPCTMIQDIAVYLRSHETVLDKVSLTKRLLCDYKEQKAYSYFSAKFLFEIYYHAISDQSPFCFLKARCTPSQRLSDVPHESWVAIRKASGEIQSAYCTCFAGLGQTCNHVAALLLKVDFSWQVGDVNKACTSEPCVWAGRSKQVAPVRIQDLHIRKPMAEREEPSRYLNCPKKRLFSPQNKAKGMTEGDFLQRLAALSPESITLGERSAERSAVYREYDANSSVASPITQCVETLPPSIENIASHCSTFEEFIDNLPQYSVEEIKAIEKGTNDQDELVWANQRKGRVTASKFHRVSSRMDTKYQKPDASMEAVIKEVLLYNKPPAELKALKYGRRMENPAAIKFGKVYQELGHKNVKVSKCGLFVSQVAPYMGASPDGIITCDCCGEGVLEIKCPLTCSHTSPSSENLPYLKSDDTGVVNLQRNHAYYTQIQGQMALTDNAWGYIFVFSKHGYFIEKLQFDSIFWSHISQNITHFFYEHLAIELVSRKIRTQMEIGITASEKDTNHSINEQAIASTSNTEGSASAVASKRIPPRKSTKGKGKKVKGKSTPVYLCGTCSHKCEDVEKRSLPKEKFSVQCDFCKKWHHWGCVNFIDSDSDNDDDFMCPLCSASYFNHN